MRWDAVRHAGVAASCVSRVLHAAPGLRCSTLPSVLQDLSSYFSPDGINAECEASTTAAALTSKVSTS